MNYQKNLDFAIKIAHAAGKVLMQYYGKFEASGTKEDGWTADAITADKEADRCIRKLISQNYPSDSLFTEESESTGNSCRIWRADPLDGTNNFKRGNTESSVAISLEDDKNVLLGVVYNPILDVLYYATLDGGAWMVKSGKSPVRMQVSGEKTLREAFVTLNVDFLAEKNIRKGAEILGSFSSRCPGMRPHVYESTALELAYVACGRSTAHLGLMHHPWDYSAGMIIVKEAGGKVADFEGNKIALPLRRQNIVASNSYVHDELLEIVSRAVN